jgi:histidine triad (HIT) family protein
MVDGAYSSCVFCQIVAGDLPAEIVHSSDRIVAFRDVNPQAPVHILLISKEHIASVAELDASHGDTLAELFVTATHLAKAEDVDRSGWRIVTNVGADAGQTVEHLHFHLLGGRPMAWPPG